MNTTRRKAIEKAETMIAEAREIISAAAEEEREAFDSMPESMQSGERGGRMEEISDNLQDAAAELENIEIALSEARE